MSILTIILTCRGREKSLERLLDSIKDSDWPNGVNVVQDSEFTSNPEPYFRVQDAVRGIFEKFLNSGCDYLLYLEDDVIVNKHIYHNIMNFEPLRNGEVNWLILCDFGSEGDGYIVTDKKITAGAQGIVVSRFAAKFLLEHEWDAQFDKLLPEILMKNGMFVHRYIPSIVQHCEGKSAIGGEDTVLFSQNYDHTFKLDIV